MINNGRFKKGMIPCNKGIKGQIPWNKGKKMSSESCEKMSKAHKGVKLSLKTCKRMSKAKTGIKLTQQTKEKLSLQKLGPLNPQWKGGVTPIFDIIRRSDKYKVWRMSVFERDNFTCQISGLCIGGELEAHHIKNFANNEEIRFKLNNGITIHKDIHSLFHKKYGYNNNTLEQIEQFKEEYKNGYE